MDYERNERLASLEAKMQMVLDTLKEIKEDLKNQPSREEFDKHMTSHAVFEAEVRNSFSEMAKEVNRVERKHNEVAIKVGTISSAVGMIVGYIIHLIIK